MCFHTSTMVEQSRPELDFAPNLDFNEILTNPILDIAARFWEDERYEAFRICYRSMRIIDDLVDNRKATGSAISQVEREQYGRMIADWVDSIRCRRPSDDFQEKLIATIKRFRIPAWPWEKLASAMTYDLAHDGYPTFKTFLRYCKGAAVAPASVFMHLCGMIEENGVYRKPLFDSRKAARPLAIFSYLVHIVRDFQKDQKNNLNYFAHDLLLRHGLTAASLREIAKTGELSRSFRNLMAQYQGLAEYYRRKARMTIDPILPHLKTRYQLSLEVIYSLYLQIFERIDPQAGSFRMSELNPMPGEIQDRIDHTIAVFQPV
jgi:phytoene/squalene synthetase